MIFFFYWNNVKILFKKQRKNIKTMVWSYNILEIALKPDFKLPVLSLTCGEITLFVSPLPQEGLVFKTQCKQNRHIFKN